ncbi:MAG: hypothetical protein WAL63_09795 [Solirubrobacteraceae bacterium]
MTAGHFRRAPVTVAMVLAAVAVLAGCFDVQSSDLFLLTRTGPARKLTLLVNNSGTLSCNGAKAKTISSAMLIQARDLAVDLTKDATDKLTIPASPTTVNYFRVKLQQGTVSFPDRAAHTQKALAEAELFALAAAQQVCGLRG